MNVIRGLDRIVLIIAVIAILPGFVIGFFFVEDEFKAVTPEYQKWKKKREQIEYEYALDGSNLRFLLEQDTVDKEQKKQIRKDIERRLDDIWPPPKYKRPEKWQCVLGGRL